MIQVVPYKAAHFESLTAQEGQAYLRAEFTMEQAAALEGTANAFTALDESGAVLCSAGVVEYWPNRAEAWAFVSPLAKKEGFAVTRAVRRFLHITPIRRVEAAVDINFVEGVRWVNALGFSLASPWPMKAYKPDGADCWLYARVK